jgi:hypothetical protein
MRHLPCGDGDVHTSQRAIELRAVGRQWIGQRPSVAAVGFDGYGLRGTDTAQARPDLD